MIVHTRAEVYHPVVIKDKQRFWKRILIVDDDADVTVTFKAGIEENNNNNDANKTIEVYTSNDPVIALSEFKPHFYDSIIANIQQTNSFFISSLFKPNFRIS